MYFTPARTAISESQFSLDRRQTIQWLISGLGWLIASVFTLTKILDQSASQIPEQEKLPSSFYTDEGINNAENRIRSKTDSKNTSDDKIEKGFGLGWLDVVVMFFILLLIFGPKKLPEIGRSLGKFVKGFQDASREFEEEFQREAARIEEETTENGPARVDKDEEDYWEP